MFETRSFCSALSSANRAEAKSGSVSMALAICEGSAGPFIFIVDTIRSLFCWSWVRLGMIVEEKRDFYRLLWFLNWTGL